jgi:hypothetical protein
MDDGAQRDDGVQRAHSHKQNSLLEPRVEWSSRTTLGRMVQVTGVNRRGRRTTGTRMVCVQLDSHYHIADFSRFRPCVGPLLEALVSRPASTFESCEGPRCRTMVVTADVAFASEGRL